MEWVWDVEGGTGEVLDLEAFLQGVQGGQERPWREGRVSGLRGGGEGGVMASSDGGPGQSWVFPSDWSPCGII